MVEEFKCKRLIMIEPHLRTNAHKSPEKKNPYGEWSKINRGYEIG